MDIFRKMIEQKLQREISRSLRARSNVDLKDMAVAYHKNALQELLFTAHCKVYGKEDTYVVEGKIDDMGEIFLHPEKEAI